MNEMTMTASTSAKSGKVVFLMENILEIGLNHADGYTTLYFDVQDMPVELRQKLDDCDDDTLDLLEAYLDNYYTDAELDSIEFVRGDSWHNEHRWKEAFSYDGAFRGFLVKVKGWLAKLANNI